MTKKTTKKIIKKTKSSYDEFIETLTPKELAEYKKEYRELLLSEMLLAIMAEDDISVRKLAKEAGVSPTIIQGIRSGTNQNVTVKSLVKILKALDSSLMVIERNGNQIPLDLLRS